MKNTDAKSAPEGVASIAENGRLERYRGNHAKYGDYEAYTSLTLLVHYCVNVWVLCRATSRINRCVYPPWSDADLAVLRAVSPIAQDFCDPDGLPGLAAKQKSHFQGWMRPHELCDLPKMVHLISSFSIKQVDSTLV